jgi:hypothetical protein
VISPVLLISVRKQRTAATESIGCSVSNRHCCENYHVFLRVRVSNGFRDRSDFVSVLSNWKNHEPSQKISCFLLSIDASYRYREVDNHLVETFTRYLWFDRLFVEFSFSEEEIDFLSDSKKWIEDFCSFPFW